MRARTIPEELEPVVLKWFLEGEPYRVIGDRLYAEYQIDTSAGSVHRVIDRLARGEGCDGAVRTVAKLRMNAPRLVEKLQQQLALAEKMAGLESSIEVPAGMTQKALDFINKLTLRELKVAGCTGRDAERTLELAREAVEEHCQTDEEIAARELEEIVQKARTIEKPSATSVSAPRNGQDRPVPVVTSAKQGRNDKCACGSGLKFKRCCGGPAAQVARRSEPRAMAV